MIRVLTIKLDECKHWKCDKCKCEIKGYIPDECPKCKGRKFQMIWDVMK